jgi:hypothetical protein
MTWKAQVFVRVIHFHPCLMFAGKAGAYTRINSKGRLQAFPQVLDQGESDK